MESIMWVAIYLLIGWYLSDLIDEDDGGGASFLTFMFWPIVILIWAGIMLIVVIPDSIKRWFKYRKYRRKK